MADTSKVVYDGETLIDLTSDTVSADTLATGYTAHTANGDVVTGTLDTYTKTEIDELLNAKQDTLVSGTNIKTVDSKTLLGSGDVPITPELYVATYNSTKFTDIYTAYKAGKIVLVNYSSYVGYLVSCNTSIARFTYAYSNAYLISITCNSSNTWSMDTISVVTSSDVNAKQDALVSGTNIKTINSNSILGSGDIEISCDTLGAQPALTDSGWQELTLTNCSASSTLYVPRIKKIGNTAQVNGVVKLSSSLASGSYVELADIPDEFCPCYYQSWSGTADTRNIRFLLRSAGTLRLYNIDSSSIGTSIEIFFSHTYLLGE